MSSNRVSIDTNVITFRTVMDGGRPLQPPNYLTVIKDIGQITYVPPLQHFSSYGVGYLPSTFQDFLAQASTICGTIIPFPPDTVPSSYVFSTISTLNTALDTLTVQLGQQVSTVCTTMVALSNVYAANVATKVLSSQLISSQNGMLSSIATQEANFLHSYGAVSSAERVYSTLSDTIAACPFSSISAAIGVSQAVLEEQIVRQQENLSSIGLSRQDQILTVSTNIQNLSNTIVGYSNYLDQQTQGSQMSSFSSSVFAPAGAINTQLDANTTNLNNMSTYLFNSTITKVEFIEFSTLVHTAYYNITYESLSSLSAPLGATVDAMENLAAYVSNEAIKPAQVSSLSTQIGINHGPFYPNNISSISSGIATSYSNINTISTATATSTIQLDYYEYLSAGFSTQRGFLQDLSQQIYSTTLQSTTLGEFWASYWSRGSPIDGVLSTQLISSTKGIYDNPLMTGPLSAPSASVGLATTGTAQISSFITDASYINIQTQSLNVNDVLIMENGFNQSKTATLTITKSNADYYINSNIVGTAGGQILLGGQQPYGFTTDGGYSISSTPTYLLAFGPQTSYLLPTAPTSQVQSISHGLTQTSDVVFVGNNAYQAGQYNGQAAVALYTPQQQPQIRYVPALTSLTSLAYNANTLIVSGISGSYDYYIAYSKDNASTWTLQNLNANTALNMKYVSAVRRLDEQTVIVGKTNDICGSTYSYVIRATDISNAEYTRDTVYDFAGYTYASNSFFKFIDIAADNVGRSVAIGPDYLTGIGRVPIAVMVNTGQGWVLINTIFHTPISQSGSIRVFYEAQLANWVIQSDSYTFIKPAAVLLTNQDWTQISPSVCPGYYILPTRSLYFNAKTDVATQIIEKTTGSFEIPHTDPVKAAKGAWLRHCFTEAPTRGDNIYRFVANGPDATIQLPEYFAALNENVQTFVSADDVLTDVWTDVYDPATNTVRVYSAAPATLNVLVVGTRKDKAAIAAFDERGGVEYTS